MVQKTILDNVIDLEIGECHNSQNTFEDGTMEKYPGEFKNECYSKILNIVKNRHDCFTQMYNLARNKKAPKGPNHLLL